MDRDDHPKVHHLEPFDILLDLYEIIDEAPVIEGIGYHLGVPTEGEDPVLLVIDADREVRRFRLTLTEEKAPLPPPQHTGRRQARSGRARRPAHAAVDTTAGDRPGR